MNVTERSYIRLNSNGIRLDRVITLDEGTTVNADVDEDISSQDSVNSTNDIILDEGHF